MASRARPDTTPSCCGRAILPVVEQLPEARFNVAGDRGEVFGAVVPRVPESQFEVQGTVRADDVGIHALGWESTRSTRKVRVHRLALPCQIYLRMGSSASCAGVPDGIGHDG